MYLQKTMATGNPKNCTCVQTILEIKVHIHATIVDVDYAFIQSQTKVNTEKFIIEVLPDVYHP